MLSSLQLQAIPILFEYIITNLKTDKISFTVLGDKPPQPFNFPAVSFSSAN